ncbi:MAG: arsenosugar biosynthesis radical SAM protein ArsS [Candidatus Electryonea clarkiae]|nr:arsenosugar biosynthesis radical SAM protein ArsS [Candidatus Electryonea clarkiae]MDP8287588.1 arsenosugar biosynthesis radical SAM protein ArsS [Candidatus Electryonea clarkiae]
MEGVGQYPLRSTEITILQLNVGTLCNMSCKHCHVNAGPGGKAIMPREVFEECLRVLDSTSIPVVDITGGAPELNPHFLWFVKEVRRRGLHIIDRCNLTVLHETGQEGLPEFLAENEVEVIASLTGLSEQQTDAQRGQGAFSKSIEALNRLNDVGYAQPGRGLELHLITNPSGAFLPANQESMEQHWKEVLLDRFDIIFNRLYTLTNMPIGRYLSWLRAKDLLSPYMKKLYDSFNPDAARGVMCLFTLSVDWQGYLYDCDFNQMLDLKVNHGLPTHIKDFNHEAFRGSIIETGAHCYGCTAGSGSSCGGATA